MAVDLTMSEGPAEEGEEEVGENSAAYRGGDISVADSLEFVAEERRALIEPAPRQAASNPQPPTAPCSMRENQKDPKPARPPRSRSFNYRRKQAPPPGTETDVGTEGSGQARGG